MECWEIVADRVKTTGVKVSPGATRWLVAGSTAKRTTFSCLLELTPGFVCLNCSARASKTHYLRGSSTNKSGTSRTGNTIRLKKSLRKVVTFFGVSVRRAFRFHYIPLHLRK